jgi:hypothetical protein
MSLGRYVFIYGPAITDLNILKDEWGGCAVGQQAVAQNKLNTLFSPQHGTGC